MVALRRVKVYRPGANLPNLVSGGYIPVSAAYCYTAVVHNTSNDGTFIPG